MNAPLPAFQQFQMAFGRRCRDPRAARPAGVPARRMAVYEELLFNNITGFLDACFPVCRKLIGDTRWQRLNRAFFRDWRSATPLFREIPQEFLRFLATAKQPLPAWFRELAHYEWVELAVDTSAATPPPHDPDGDLMRGRPLVNPTLMNLAYDWPVHRIGPDWRPRRPAPTWLLVFRDDTDSVRFVETNAATARLIALIVEVDYTGAGALERLAAELDPKCVASLHPSPCSGPPLRGVLRPSGWSAMAARLHGPAILDDLLRQGAIQGVRT